MLLLLDHENVPSAKRLPESLIVPWLAHLLRRGLVSPAPVLTVTTRVYGGWYSGQSVAPKRYDAMAFYAEKWPALAAIVPDQLVRCSIEFADYLLETSSALSPTRPKITNTVAVRSAPPRLGLTDTFRACGESDCQRSRVRRWLSKGKGCTSDSCPNDFADCFIRREQKQVDMHLAVDLLEACVHGDGIEHVALASDDIDFIPAVALALRRRRSTLSSLSLVRGTGQRPLYCEADFRALGCEVVFY
jgi:NYN domain